MALTLPTFGGKKSILHEKPQKGMYSIQVTQNIPFLMVAFWNQVLLLCLMKYPLELR